MKERKRVDRLGLFSIIASRLALANAALELTDENRTRVGAVVGTGVGPMESMEEFAAPVIAEGAGGSEPGRLPEHRLQRGRRAGRDQERRSSAPPRP